MNLGADRPRDGDNGDVPGRFWPYSRPRAFKISLLLVPTLAVAMFVLRETWSDESPTGWELLGAVLLGLIPTFLTVLDGLAANKGTLEAPGGIKVSFAAIRSVASTETDGVNIAAVIGGSVTVNVLDTGGRAVMEALRPVLGAETAVLRLGEGNEWWQTRLLLLTSGASRLGRPRAIVFTATESGKEDQFIGWARPSELLRVHLSNAPRALLNAYHRGQAEANRYAIGVPVSANDLEPELPVPTTNVVMPWPSVPAGANPTMSAPHLAIPEMVPEHFLLEALSRLEPPEPVTLPNIEMTGEFVKRMFGVVLRRDPIERDETDDRWREHILDNSEEYCAVTDHGAFVMLFTRHAATTAMLRSLVRK